MSSLSKMRKSRDMWKIKNSAKRKRVNQLNRLVVSLNGRVQQRDVEIEWLRTQLGLTSKIAASSAEELQRELTNAAKFTLIIGKRGVNSFVKSAGTLRIPIRMRRKALKNEV